MRVTIALTLLIGTTVPTLAESFATTMPWDSPSYRAPARASQGAWTPPAQPRREARDRQRQADRAPRQGSRQASARDIQPGPKVLDGGGRPSIAPIAPRSTGFVSNYSPGTIVIDTSRRQLYLVQSRSQAFVYPVSVGREGFEWTGTERISRIASWPDWRPPAEMRAREPHLPELMTGGVRNPLGAVALYLGSTLYRIHGTNSTSSIGQAASSGCFRMLNGHVVDLARRVSVGARVVVLSQLPANVARSTQ